jgi:hypothetical protein
LVSNFSFDSHVNSLRDFRVVEVHAAYDDARVGLIAMSMKAHKVEPIVRDEHAILRDREGEDVLILNGPVGIACLKGRQDIVSQGA